MPAAFWIGTRDVINRLTRQGDEVYPMAMLDALHDAGVDLTDLGVELSKKENVRALRYQGTMQTMRQLRAINDTLPGQHGPLELALMELKASQYGVDPIERGPRHHAEYVQLGKFHLASAFETTS